MSPCCPPKLLTSAIFMYVMRNLNCIMKSRFKSRSTLKLTNTRQWQNYFLVLEKKIAEFLLFKLCLIWNLNFTKKSHFKLFVEKRLPINKRQKICIDNSHSHYVGLTRSTAKLSEHSNFKHLATPFRFHFSLFYYCS